MGNKKAAAGDVVLDLSHILDKNIAGDCIEVMNSMPEKSVDLIVLAS